VLVVLKKKGAAQAPVALHAREYRKFVLAKKENVNHNTMLFRFNLANPKHRVGLPVGQHMMLRFTDAEGKPVIRAYTPVTSDEQLGYFDLIIKIYDQGRMGQHLKNMPVGGTIEARGPSGELHYHGHGKFSIRREVDEKKVTVDQEVKKIGMIAGGSGITPMLQIIRDVAARPTDKTEVSLLFANVTEEDILLKSELDKFAAEHKNIKITYTLDRPSESWTGERGFVSAEMIQKHLPAAANDSLVLLCGPPPMMNFMEKNLKGLDFQAVNYFVY